MRALLTIALTVCLAEPVLAVCPTASNLIPNCGFETDTNSWTLNLGDTLVRTTAAARTGLASAEINAADAGFLLIRSGCMSLQPSTSYGYGAYIRHVSGAVPTTCKVQFRTNADAVCSASPSFQDTPLIAITNTDWSLAFRTVTSSATAQSGWLDVSCVGGDDATVVRIDDVFLGAGLEPAMFANGFE